MTRSDKIEFVDIGSGFVKTRTQKAVKIHLDSDNNNHWIPLSQMASATEEVAVFGAKLDSIRVQSWLANKIGIDR